MKKIFVSYRRSDSAETVGRIAADLQRVFGKDCLFRDIDNIPYGEQFPQVIESALEDCAVVLAVIGKRWIDEQDSEGRRRLDDEKDFVRLEILAALRKGKPIIPVLVQQAKMPSIDELPLDIQELSLAHAAQIRTDPDYEHDLHRLCRHLRRILKRGGVISRIAIVLCLSGVAIVTAAKITDVKTEGKSRSQTMSTPAPQPITPAPQPTTPAPQPTTPAPQPTTPAPELRGRPGDDFYRRGLDNVRKGRVHEAMGDFSKAIEKGTLFPDAYLQRARLNKHNDTGPAIKQTTEDYLTYLATTKDRAVVEEFVSYLDNHNNEPLARSVRNRYGR